MPKLEKDIQDRFFDVLMDQKKGFEGTPLNVYQKLVFMRYEEVIKNSLPIFTKYISEDELEEQVRAFMKDTPETAFVWKIPGDFIEFAKKNEVFANREYLYELMTYDWLEVELYMTEYKDKKQKKFKLDKKYKLSKSARVKQFDYDIVGNEYKTLRENYVVTYYDFASDDVIYREINPLIYFILLSMNKKQTFQEVLEEICQENEIDFDEAKALLEEPFSELHAKRVFD